MSEKKFVCPFCNGPIEVVRYGDCWARYDVDPDTGAMYLYSESGAFDVTDIVCTDPNCKGHYGFSAVMGLDIENDVVFHEDDNELYSVE